MPKMVEVDEEQLLRDARLRQTLEKIMADPEAALLAEKALKKVDPNAKTPRLDQQKVVSEPIDDVKKQLADFIAATNKRNEEAEAERKRNELRASIDAGMAQLRADGWTDEGIKSVEKIMEDKGIIDPAVAAAYHEKMHPPQMPVTPTSGGAWNFPEIPKDGGDTYEKALLDSKGGNDLIAERRALEVLQEIRGSRR